MAFPFLLRFPLVPPADEQVCSKLRLGDSKVSTEIKNVSIKSWIFPHEMNISVFFAFSRDSRIQSPHGLAVETRVTGATHLRSAPHCIGAAMLLATTARSGRPRRYRCAAKVHRCNASDAAWGTQSE